jgi:MFS family permease
MRKSWSPWWIVAGCTLALATSSGVIMAFTFSLFIEPLSTEFGWSRATVSLGFSMAALLTAAAAPLLGRLLDRVGARRTLMYAVPAYALCVALLAATPAQAGVFLGLFALAGIAGAGHSPIAYVTLVSAWFDARRGLALGLAMSGIGIGAALMPQLAGFIIERLGWRAAYVALGATIFLVGLPAVVLLLREAPATVTAAPAAPVAQGAVGARTSLLRDARFLTLAAFIFLLTVAVNGCTVHAVPLLVAHGYTRLEATSVLGALGVASLGGRLLCGYALDHVFAPWLAAATAGLALCGTLLLGAGPPPAGAALGLVLLGFALGAETDLMSYLTSRYFERERFGESIGLLYAVFGIAAATGAPLMGASFDATGSYGAALGWLGAGLAIAALAVLRLGPYAYPPQHDATS